MMVSSSDYSSMFPLADWRLWQNFSNCGWGANNFNFCTPWGNNFYTGISSSSSSSSSGITKSEDSYEEWKKKALAKQKEAEETSVFQTEKAEYVQQQKDLIAAKANVIDAVKKGKKTDGSAVVESAKLADPVLKPDGTIDKEASKPKEKGFWDKAGDWAASAGSAVVNIGKSFIGFDENGKWSAKKCLKNVGISAAAVACTFIPVVGPVIGCGLLAYGAVSGTVGAVKGIVKYNKAETEEEKEQARQETCTGAIIGTLSAFGLKGLGSAFRASGTTAGTTTGTTSRIASVAKPRTGMGKVVQKTSQFGRDVTVNALKATGNAVKSDKALISAKGGGITGFFMALGSKIRTTFTKHQDFQYIYNSKYQQMETSLNNRIAELEARINAETNSAARALLKEQKTMLEGNLNELNSLSGIKTKTEFDKLKTTNSGTKNQERLSSYTQSSRGYEIDGASVSSKRFEAFKHEMAEAQKLYIKDLNKLIKSKECVMRHYANKPDAHRAELNDYVQQNIRNKYNTPGKLKTGVETLTKKISDLETKIAETEAKIARVRTQRTRTAQENKLAAMKKQKAGYENELSVCSEIEFKGSFKRIWDKRTDYQKAIGGYNIVAGGKTCLKLAFQPKVPVPPLLTAQVTGTDYTPMFGSLKVFTPEQTEEYLQELEKEKQELESELESIEAINTKEEWDAIKARVAAQLQAQAESQAQAQAQAQAQE